MFWEVLVVKCWRDCQTVVKSSCFVIYLISIPIQFMYMYNVIQLLVSTRLLLVQIRIEILTGCSDRQVDDIAVTAPPRGMAHLHSPRCSTRRCHNVLGVIWKRLKVWPGSAWSGHVHDACSYSCLLSLSMYPEWARCEICRRLHRIFTRATTSRNFLCAIVRVS